VTIQPKTDTKFETRNPAVEAELRAKAHELVADLERYRRDLESPFTSNNFHDEIVAIIETEGKRR
jgi:hypothetical protein